MNSPKHSTEYISAIDVKQTSNEAFQFNFNTNIEEKR